MHSLSKRLGSKGQRAPFLPVLHLELWVGLRKDRAGMSRITRKIYLIARQVTEDEEGGGPESSWSALVGSQMVLTVQPIKSH